MTEPGRLMSEHLAVSRRFFLKLGVAGAAGLSAAPLLAENADPEALLAAAVGQLEYLTGVESFRTIGRGKPKPNTLPPEKLRQVGLTKQTWQLEVIADPESDSRIEKPLSKELGTALDWDGLMRLAETRAVRYLKVMTCTNADKPFGMGLWEGVPLGDVIWLTRPKANVRRVYYYGYHNDDPRQRFQSSLPISRVLEAPPGEEPVLLCYKLNGHWLSPAEGAPVRMLVPEAYGNKSVKWLQRVLLTNDFKNNDTYAEWNNDTTSPLKTCAHFIHVPPEARPGRPLPVTGLAQVGTSGLAKVEVWLAPQGENWPEDDPYFSKAPWREATILPPPDDWGGGLPEGKLPPGVSRIDAATGKPRAWPLRNTIAHWAVLLEGIAPGKYELRCRTIDARGFAQPMPRPFPKGGRNAIQVAKLVVG